MPRTTTVPFNTAIGLPVTAVGYLLQMALPATVLPVVLPAVTLRWCDIGDVNYAGFFWSRMSFTFSGLSFDVDTPVSDCSLTVSNLDSAISTLFQLRNMADVPLTVYQIARGVVAGGDAPILADLAVDSVDLTPESVAIKLLAVRSTASFFPRRRIDPYYGFHYALPARSQIAWGNQIYVLEEDDNG